MSTPSPASEANDAIRRFVDAQTTGADSPSEDYEVLLTEWATAMQGRIEPAA